MEHRPRLRRRSQQAHERLPRFDRKLVERVAVKHAKRRVRRSLGNEDGQQLKRIAGFDAWRVLQPDLACVREQRRPIRMLRPDQRFEPSILLVVPEVDGVEIDASGKGCRWEAGRNARHLAPALAFDAHW